MTTRSGFFCALFAWFSSISILMAQEHTPSGSTPIGSPSPAPSSSPNALLSSSVTPTPSPTPPKLSDVLFKNLKARSIGPAVMVYPDGVWYAQVRSEDVIEIIDEHLLGGKIVNRLALMRVPAEGCSSSSPSREDWEA